MAAKKKAVKVATKEVVKVEEPRELITQDTIIKYMESFGLASQLSDNEKIQFIEIARQYQLNPFKREIYCIPYETAAKKPNRSFAKKLSLSIITFY